MEMSAKNFKILFVHGYTSSSRSDWYPKIASELKNLGIDFTILDLPGGQSPHASEWLKEIHTAVSQTSKPVVLVGHSLGTRAIPLYLEKYKQRAKAVFLIAAFANRLENAYKYDVDAYTDFFEHLIDIDSIKSLVEKFVVMHSKDDPLDYEQGVEIAKQLNAILITYEDRGHFSDAENAPIVLGVLRKELAF
jgi:predicted alpha/beta hydrolase family esterase